MNMIRYPIQSNMNEEKVGKETINLPPIPKGSPSASSDWAKDPRIAFSQVTGKWIFEDIDSGAEYEYNEEVRNWIPVLEEEDLKSQQQIYQAKRVPDKDEDGNSKHQTKKAKNEHKERKTTGIYISNLPKDVTNGELDYIFSKYGVIAEDLNTGEKKIKVYKDDNNEPKGDALIVYFKPESVPLAIEMMDNSELRPGEPGRNLNGKISVQKAEFKNSDKTKPTEHEKPKLNVKEKLKIQKKLQKINDKLADWDDDEPKTISKRWEKVVTLKNVFTLEELEQDSNAAFDIKQDIMEGCEDIGTVTNVTLYDLEPDGIVNVKFQDKDHALICVQRMNGRYFAGKQLEAFMYDGKKYRKTNKEDEDEKEQERLEKFGSWLEQGN